MELREAAAMLELTPTELILTLRFMQRYADFYINRLGEERGASFFKTLDLKYWNKEREREEHYIHSTIWPRTAEEVLLSGLQDPTLEEITARLLESDKELARVAILGGSVKVLKGPGSQEQPITDPAARFPANANLTISIGPRFLYHATLA